MKDSKILDADCSAVQRFVEENAEPTLRLALETVPHLVECLTTHEMIPGAPRFKPAGLFPQEVTNLNAFGLNLNGALLASRHVEGGRLRGVSMVGTKAGYWLARNVTFVGCYLHGSDFFKALFVNCRFVGCEISKNDFREVTFKECEFLECDVYANWARGVVLKPKGRTAQLTEFQIEANFGADAFGFGERSPWEEGFCDGHEVSALIQQTTEGA